MSVHLAFGIAAGLASFVSMALYVAAILQKKCEPSKVSYWIWFVLSLLILISYRKSGGSAMILLVMYAINPFVAAVLSIWYGEKNEDLPRWVVVLNVLCVMLAAVSIPLWWMLRQHYGDNADSALPVLGVNLFADALGAFSTFEKTWNRPEKEDKRAWLICLLAATLNLGAVAEWGAPDIAWNGWMWGAALFITLSVYLRPPSQPALVSKT